MPNGPPREKQDCKDCLKEKEIEKRSAKEIDENDDATNDDQSANFNDHEPHPPSVNQAGHPSVAPPYSQ